MRPTHRATGLVVVLTAVLVLAALLMPAPAQAERTDIRDGENRRMSHGDISLVQVDHAPRKVFTTVKYHGWGTGEKLRVYYDTRKGNRGPEFVLDAYIITEAEVVDRWKLERIDSFRQGQRGKGRTIRCRGDRAAVTKTGGVATRVPRHCLEIKSKAPRKVRVSVYSWAYRHDPSLPYKTWYDWAPGRKSFGPWVSRG